MISVTQLRNGTTFVENREIYKVLSYEHIKMGRGSANIRVRVRNLRTASTTDKTFISGARVEEIFLTKRELQFLYKDSDLAYFMDPITFEQVNIQLKILPEHQLLKESEVFSLSFWDEQPLGFNLPPKMKFKVLETGPAIRGNSATNIYKDAILENGIKTKVPLFIKVGDRILIDTQTLTYHEKTT